MTVQKVGDWYKAAKILNGLSERYQMALLKGLSRTGQMLRDETRKGIRDQAPGGEAFEPLSQFTIRNKGSTKALIDHGDLVNAITFKVIPAQMAVFVGVLRTATSKRADTGEQYLANIARIHELGAIVPVTPKMRAYFRARWGINLRKAYIVIPARPFLQPTFKAYGPKAVGLFRETIARVLRGSSP